MSNWTSTPPSEPGSYWLWGGDIVGACGAGYTDARKDKPKLHYVTIRKISNGLMAVADGHFIGLNRFNPSKHYEGHVGYWKPVELPAPPSAFEDLFHV